MSMQRVILTVGIPASSKSTWAKAEIAKAPNDWVRVNNDDLRAMMNGSVWSFDYEKIITDARNYLIRDGLKRGKHIIIDNLNLNRRHFDDTCNIAKSLNIDCTVMEKAFYVDVDEAIARDAKRTGSAQVGEKVIRDWWKKSWKTQHQFYKGRVEIFTKQAGAKESGWFPMEQDETKKKAIIVDLDGTLATIGNRSPYSAKDCDLIDSPNKPVVETVRLYHEAGYAIVFCSGRMNADRDPTMRFIAKCLPDMKNYELHMRTDNDIRKDSIVKSELLGQFKDRYNILLVLDDRKSVVQFWRSRGLTCFQVAEGDF